MFIKTSKAIINRNHIIRVFFLKGGDQLEVTLSDNSTFRFSGEEARLITTCLTPSVRVGSDPNYEHFYQRISPTQRDNLSEIEAELFTKR
jgi:hypothetical protein